MIERNYKKKLEKIKRQGEMYKLEAELREKYAEYLPDSKKKRTVSNTMLIVIVTAIVGYVVANFILQYKVGVEVSPTITTCWFAFWGTEIIALTAIKTSKLKHNVDNFKDEYDEYPEDTDE